MHVFGVVCMALGSLGLLIFAGYIAGKEVRSWLYRHEMDTWAEDVHPWH